jgi:hypothetical protein
MHVIDGVIRTKHRHGRCIAESLATDNLSEMSTHAEGEYVITGSRVIKCGQSLPQ